MKRRNPYSHEEEDHEAKHKEGGRVENNPQCMSQKISLFLKLKEIYQCLLIYKYLTKQFITF